MASHDLTWEHISDFQAHLRREDRSPGTVEKYVRDVGGLRCWLDGRAVDREVVTAWRDHLLSRGYAPVTVNSMLAACNSLFRFLGWEDCRVRFLKIQRRVFRAPERELTSGEYQRLLQTARRDGKERLELLMESICACGIRASEVRYLTVEAVRRKRADVSLKGKIRTILIPAKLCRKLLDYAKKQKIASGEIFLTRNGTGMNRKQIWAAMKSLCEKAGVAASKVFPHNLRHLFARTFYTASRDIAKLADVLGHSSIETTRIYLLSSGNEHARQMEQLGLIL